MPVDLSDIGLKGIQIAAQVDQERAAARYNNANAANMELANQQTQIENSIQQQALSKISTVAKGGNGAEGSDLFTPSNDDSKAAPLEQLGSLMISGGAVKRGSEYLKAGMAIRKQEDDMLTAQETRNKDQLDNIVKAGNIFSQTLGTAKNESEWEYGLKQLESQPELVGIFGQDNFNALKNMQYDPNVAAFLNERAISAKDRASQQLQQQTEDRQTRNAIDQANFHKAQLDIAKGNLEVRQKAQEYKEKVDGKGAASSPNANDLKAAESSIANLIFNGKVPDKTDPTYVAFKSGAQDIASQAKQMVKDQKGLDFNTAITRATILSKTNGAWQTMTPDDDRGFITRTLGIGGPVPVENAKYRGPGMQAVDAVPMPMQKTQLKAGMYYVTPRGIAKWDGSNFVKD